MVRTNAQSATVGEKTLVYAVKNVPPRVTDPKVLELVVASCLIDPNAEYPTWTYDWETFESIEDYAPLDEFRTSNRYD